MTLFESPSSQTLHWIVPCRVMDSSKSNGALNGAFSNDLTAKLQLSRSVSKNCRWCNYSPLFLLMSVFSVFHRKVLSEALEKYEMSQIFLSFNGGKDCTVLLSLLSDLLKDSISDLKVIYLRSSDPFPEIEEFVRSCETFYKIKITVVPSNTLMKEVLTRICESDREIQACIMGSRRSDPYCDKLVSFQVGESRIECYCAIIHNISCSRLIEDGRSWWESTQCLTGLARTFGNIYLSTKYLTVAYTTKAIHR